MNRTHLMTCLAAAALVGLSVTPAAATAAQQTLAAETCTLRLQSTKALDLQHDADGTDRVQAQLGNTTTLVRPYTLGQRRNTNNDGTETFTGTAELTLNVEILGGAALLPIDTRTIECATQTLDLVMVGFDARYKVRAVVAVLP